MGIYEPGEHRTRPHHWHRPPRTDRLGGGERGDRPVTMRAP